jgi:hypothetical protein
VGLRILRLLEYEYEDEKRAAEDMARWTHSVPPSVKGMKMKSATLPIEFVQWEGGDPCPEG